MTEFPTAPWPEELSPEDLEEVPNPVADYRVRSVPRWMERQAVSAIPDYNVVRRCAAAICIGNWDTATCVLAEIESEDQLRRVLVAALREVSSLAINAAQGNTELAALYFENLLRVQQQMDEGGF